jgi:hypothetical protein
MTSLEVIRALPIIFFRSEVSSLASCTFQSLCLFHTEVEVVVQVYLHSVEGATTVVTP